MVPIDKLEQIKQRFEFLEAKMNDGAAGEDIAKLAKEYSELRPVVEQIGEYQTLLSDLEEAQLMLDDPDPDLQEAVRGMLATHTTTSASGRASSRVRIRPPPICAC